MGFLKKLFGRKQDESFPPVPKWEPDIKIPEDRIVDRFSYYTDGKDDFVVFQHGTCVVVPSGLSDGDAVVAAKAIIGEIYNYHLDMNPLDMDDGNLLISYNHPAYNVVLNDICERHAHTIKQRHLDALARAEVLFTPMGANKFDVRGMKALFGRCYFYMDAKQPVVSRIVRKKSEGQTQ